MEMSEWPEQKKNDIKAISAKLINALKNFWLITGRRHDGIAAAAMVIAGEALCMFFSPPFISIPFLNVY